MIDMESVSFGSEKKDIFDKIMGMALFRWAEPFYKKYKEVLLYLFFGGLAFIVSIVSFYLLIKNTAMNELVANLLSWIITVTFAYLTNRIWVFDAATDNKRELLNQIWKFYSGRIVTLIIEEVILFVFISWLGMNSIFIKTIAQIVVIVLNYVISKLFVFTKEEKE